MKKTVHKFFIGGQHFRKEFRRQLRLLILITLGFTIAFAWRQTVFDASQSLVKFFINVQGSVTASVLTSIFISLISLVIIYITSQALKDHSDND